METYDDEAQSQYDPDYAIISVEGSVGNRPRRAVEGRVIDCL